MNLISIFNGLMKAFFQLLKSLLSLCIPISLIFLAWILIVVFFYFYYRFIKKIKPKPFDSKPSPFPGMWKNLVLLFPKRLALDILERDRNEFQEHGIHVVVGAQGEGKSITVVYLLRKWQARYSGLKIYTNNFEYDRQNGNIETWQDIISYKNGKKGVVNVLDEMQTWFPSSKDKSTVPPELLGEICQQRKQRKAMLGTVQVFTRLAKPFREQTRYIYVPRTFLGCLTIVRVTKAKYYDPVKDKFYKYCGFFLFAHTKELRNAYDTYKIIEKYKDANFVPYSTILDGSSSEVPSVTDAEGTDNA